MLIYRDVAETIHGVHEWMRKDFIWTPDAKLYRAVERWGLPVQQAGKHYDDCDGWAFMALKLWADAGLPLDCLYPACCAVVSDPYDHCVAVAETDRGPIVSCCNQARLQFKNALPYWGWIRPANGGKNSIAAGWEMF